MNIKQAVMLALQISILSTVFGFGLRATIADLLYVIRKPGLLARSLVAILVIMPVVAVALVQFFAFPHAVEIVLIALAISPVPPLLPQKQSKAGGHASFGLGLMVIMAVVSVAAVPLALEILQRYVGRPFAMAPGAIATMIMSAVLLPLAAGMAIRALLPALAAPLGKVAALLAKVLLPLAVIALLASTLSAIWALIGAGTVLAMVIFVVAGLAVGHVLGGPDRDDSIVLALSTACRHPAIALSIAAANFPDQHFAPLILLYLLVNTIVGLPYIAWQKRRAAQS